jgi:hypothetical protein
MRTQLGGFTILNDRTLSFVLFLHATSVIRFRGTLACRPFGQSAEKIPEFSGGHFCPFRSGFNIPNHPQSHNHTNPNITNPYTIPFPFSLVHSQYSD